MTGKIPDDVLIEKALELRSDLHIAEILHEIRLLDSEERAILWRILHRSFINPCPATAERWEDKRSIRQHKAKV